MRCLLDDVTDWPAAVSAPTWLLPVLAPSYKYTLSQQVSALAYNSVKVTTLPSGATKVEAAHIQPSP